MRWNRRFKMATQDIEELAMFEEFALFLPVERLCRNVILRSPSALLRINSATKNLLLVCSFRNTNADSTRVPKKSRSFARAQDDADAIFRIGTQSLEGEEIRFWN